jgi:hypothetical protein
VLQVSAETFTFSEAAMKWWRNGEQGTNSKAIFERMTGFPVTGTWGMGYPSDPDDLRRCRLLLDAVPEFSARLVEMAEVGSEWAELVAIWPSLCSKMDDEIRKHGSRCPVTFLLMQEAIEKGRKRRPETEPDRTIVIRRTR